jgi:hypothetical protein
LETATAIQARALALSATRSGRRGVLVPQPFYTHQGDVWRWPLDATVNRFIPASIRGLFDAQRWAEQGIGRRQGSQTWKGPREG